MFELYVPHACGSDFTSIRKFDVLCQRTQAAANRCHELASHLDPAACIAVKY